MAIRSGMQLFKVNPHVMVASARLLLRNTSWNEIETTVVELERPVVLCSAVSPLRQLGANAS